MLLRRITQHVKDQNWFAVTLDFLIVVVGVFLGIQIGNWNADRVLNNKAATLEQQLVVEMAAEALNFRFPLIYYQDVQTNGEAVLAEIEVTVTLSDEDFVIKAFRATQYTGKTTTRYAFDEIVATGLAVLINNQALMNDADVIYNTTWIEVAAQESRASAYRKLFRETVPLDVQRDARLRCGDPNLMGLGNDEAAVVFYQTDYVVLNYPCQLTVSNERIAFAAKVLRETEGLEPALRFRMAELDNTIALIAGVEEVIRPWRIVPELIEASDTAGDTQ